MQDVLIHLKSNRHFLINIFVVCAIIGMCGIIGMSIGIFIDCMTIQECYQELIILCVYSAILICLALLFKFYRGRSYDFSKIEIKVYKKKSHIETISIKDVESMYFIYFKFHYLITIFAGSLNEGGCWKIHIRLKDGTKKELTFFSKKDAVMLKEKLYGELLSIK